MCTACKASFQHILKRATVCFSSSVCNNKMLLTSAFWKENSGWVGFLVFFCFFFLLLFFFFWFFFFLVLVFWGFFFFFRGVGVGVGYSVHHHHQEVES